MTQPLLDDDTVLELIGVLEEMADILPLRTARARAVHDSAMALLKRIEEAL